MKTIHYFFGICLLLSSCSKDIHIPAVDFEVKTSKSTYKVGDTVKFEFAGKPANITFYSGAPGSNYEYRNRTTAEGAIPYLEFNTIYGGTGTQIGSLKVLASSTLPDMTASSMVSGNWTDISAKAVFATGPPSTYSGKIDLSSIVTKDKPIYVAFRFLGARSATLVPGNWVISTFLVTSVLPGGSTSTLARMETAGFTAFDLKNASSAWFLPTTSRNEAYILGGGLNAAESEDWLVTKPLNLSDVSPDLGKVIQNIASNPLGSYNFVYTTPGKYVVTFLVSNTSVDENKAAVRQIELTITP